MAGDTGAFDRDRNKSKYIIQTGEKVKINLREMTKAAIERIVAQGRVENEEEQILSGLKLGHSLPVIGGIELNKEPQREPVELGSTSCLLPRKRLCLC